MIYILNSAYCLQIFIASDYIVCEDSSSLHNMQRLHQITQFAKVAPDYSKQVCTRLHNMQKLHQITQYAKIASDYTVHRLHQITQNRLHNM